MNTASAGDSLRRVGSSAGSLLSSSDSSPEPEPSDSAPAPTADVETGHAPVTGNEAELKATVQRLAAELATVKQVLAL